MRFTQLVGRTLRDAPADAEWASHRLAMRAALARPLAPGIWTYLPLGWRAIERLADICREELRATGCQEMRLPALHPAEIWQATGRWERFGPALQRLRDRDGHAFALGPTYEEVAIELARSEIESHRQLPWRFFQIQSKFRDDPRPRGGLLRLREFVVLDGYSLHADADDLGSFYHQMTAAYARIFKRCDLPIEIVAASGGAMADGPAVAFMLSHDAGQDRIVHCTACTYTASADAAEFVPAVRAEGEPQPMKKVATPGADTIAGLAEFLNIPTHQTLKAVFYTRRDDNLLIFALLRGDLDIDEEKLSIAVGGGVLRPAEADEIERAGASPGYASPVGLSVRPTLDGAGVLVVADRSIEAGVNFASGANEDGFHFTNVNYPRDFEVTVMTSIAAVPEDANCPQCGEALHTRRAIELGRCRALGTRYAEAVGATFLDEAGERRPLHMGSYDIGLNRLLAAIIETHHDEGGIAWPLATAPLPVHLLTLGKGDDVREAGDRLYAELAEAGVEALYDDRPDESAGVKFNDADLIGLPLRLTVGAKGLKEGVIEVKWRTAEERETIPLSDAVEEVAARLGQIS